MADLRETRTRLLATGDRDPIARVCEAALELIRAL
jgi:hypothetical protein